MVNIAVFVSGSGTNLEAILKACESGDISSGRVMLVVSSRDGVFALERAQERGIDAKVVSRKSFSSPEKYGEELNRILDEYKIDMAVLAGFLSLLPRNIIEKYDRRIINIHPSLIPAFCGQGCYGLKVHEAAIERGVKISGATVHYANEVYDEGEIISQKAIEVLPTDTPESLQRRIMQECERVILSEAVEIVAKRISEEKSKNSGFLKSL